jgi:hypothetical protein
MAASPRAKRDEFTEAQKNWALSSNYQWLKRRWPGKFDGCGPFYICDECQYVSNNRLDFALDHVLPCAQRGTRDRHPIEVRKRLYEGDTELLYQTGMNIQVLCAGCNGAKLGGAFVPPRSGYAYTRHAQDRNPDHMYSGIPL